MSKTMKIIIISAIIILVFVLIGMVWFLRSRNILDVQKLSNLEFIKTTNNQKNITNNSQKESKPSDYSKIINNRASSSKNIPATIYKVQTPTLPTTLK